MVRLDLALALAGYGMIVSGVWLRFDVWAALVVGGVLLLGAVVKRVKA